MNTLKQFQEEVKKEFLEKFVTTKGKDFLLSSWADEHDDILGFCNQQTTLAYELGKKEMLELIDSMYKKYEPETNELLFIDPVAVEGFNTALDSLKQRLLVLNEE